MSRVIGLSEDVLTVEGYIAVFQTTLLLVTMALYLVGYSFQL